MTSGHQNHFDGTATTGVLDAVGRQCPCCATRTTRRGLARVSGAAQGRGSPPAIIEPTGANGGKLPIDPNFPARAPPADRRARRPADLRRGVVTGLPRRAGRGASRAYGNPGPDLTTLAKILRRRPAGAAAVRRAQGHPRFAGFPGHQGRRQGKDSRIPAPSTPNPLSASAGIACLKIVAEDRCLRPRQQIQRRSAPAAQRGVRGGGARCPWAAYGTFSMLELFTNPEREPVTPTPLRPAAIFLRQPQGRPQCRASCTRCAWR